MMNYNIEFEQLDYSRGCLLASDARAMRKIGTEEAKEKLILLSRLHNKEIIKNNTLMHLKEVFKYQPN